MNKRNRFSVVALSVSILLASTACFEIDQSIELDERLGGNAALEIGVDFEPMIRIMAAIQREMEGKTGPPTDEELAAARAEFREGEASATTEVPDLASANARMPEGVELVGMTLDEGSTRLTSRFRFRFDHLDKLVNLKLPSRGAPDSDASVLDSPFGNLVLLEEVDTITIRSAPENPAKNVEQQVVEQTGPTDAAMERRIKEALGDMQVTWRISAPFAVISHNATRVEGNTLIWTYDLDRLEALDADATLGVEVIYRR